MTTHRAAHADCFFKEFAAVLLTLLLKIEAHLGIAKTSILCHNLVQTQL